MGWNKAFCFGNAWVSYVMCHVVYNVNVAACVAVCCSVLQRVAACCSALQCVWACCSVLQRVKFSGLSLPHVNEYCMELCKSLCVAACCSMLQYVCMYRSPELCKSQCVVVLRVLLHVVCKKSSSCLKSYVERWGAGVETQKNVRREIGGWGRVPFNKPYAPLLSTIYDGA